MQNYKLYVKDILEMIDRIEKTSVSEIENKNNWDATLMRMQVIGESVKKIPLNIKKEYKEVRWKRLESLRNIISHAYFRVDKPIILGIINDDLPKLKEVVKKL